MWCRISGLLLRHAYLYRRSLARAGQIVFWPVMDLLVWGFITVYIQRTNPAVGTVVLFLLGAMIFWEILYRSQQAITLSVTEEIWVRNLLNIFVAPVRAHELVLATCLLGLLQSLITAALLGVLAYVFYAFNLLKVGPALIPFVASLLLFGWAVGMGTTSLVLRFGHAAEALVWGVPFLIQPFSAVFYPVDVLPVWLQAFAYLMPSTYVFEGMRAALQTGSVNARLLALALGTNAAYLAFAGIFFGWMLRRVRDKGYISRLGME